MAWSSLFNAGSRALDAVSESFSPGKNAAAKQVRVNGAICVGVGLLCFVSAIAIAIALGSRTNPGVVIVLPIIFGYAFTIVGGYRLVFGVTPTESQTGVFASFKRIFFGVTWILCLFGTPIALVLLFDWLSA